MPTYQELHSQIGQQQTTVKKHLSTLKQPLPPPPPTRLKAKPPTTPKGREEELRRVRVESKRRSVKSERKKAVGQLESYLTKLKSAEEKIKGYEKKGYKVRDSDKGLEFYKTVVVKSASKPRGDYSIWVYWQDTKTGEIKKTQDIASRFDPSIYRGVIVKIIGKRGKALYDIGKETTKVTTTTKTETMRLPFGLPENIIERLGLKHLSDPLYREFRKQYVIGKPIIFKPSEKMIIEAYTLAMGEKKPTTSFEFIKTPSYQKTLLLAQESLISKEYKTILSDIKKDQIYVIQEEGKPRYYHGKDLISKYETEQQKALTGIKTSLTKIKGTQAEIKTFVSEFRKAKEKEPALHMTIEEGKLGVKEDVSRFYKEEIEPKHFKIGGWDVSRTFATVLGGLGSVKYAWEGWFKSKPRPIEKIFDLPKGQKDVITQWEYQTYKTVKSGSALDWVKMYTIDLPAMRNIAIPMGIGMVAKPIFAYYGTIGTQLAEKGTTLTTRTLGRGVFYSPYVLGGAMGGAIAGDVITTYKLEEAGELPKGTTAIKIGELGVQLTSLYAGTKIRLTSPETVARLKTRGVKLKTQFGKIPKYAYEYTGTTGEFASRMRIGLYSAKLKLGGVKYQIGRAVSETRVSKAWTDVKHTWYETKVSAKVKLHEFGAERGLVSRKPAYKVHHVGRGIDVHARKMQFARRFGELKDIIAGEEYVTVVGRREGVVKSIYDFRGASALTRKPFTVSGELYSKQFEKPYTYKYAKGRKVVSVHVEPGEVLTVGKGELKIGAKVREVYSISVGKELELPKEIATEKIRWSIGAGVSTTGKRLAISGAISKGEILTPENIRYHTIGMFRTLKVKGYSLVRGELVDISPKTYEKLPYRVDTSGMQLETIKIVSKLQPMQKYITRTPTYKAYEPVITKKPTYSLTTEEPTYYTGGRWSALSYYDVRAGRALSLEELEFLEEGLYTGVSAVWTEKAPVITRRKIRKIGIETKVESELGLERITRYDLGFKSAFRIGERLGERLGEKMALETITTLGVKSLSIQAVTSRQMQRQMQRLASLQKLELQQRAIQKLGLVQVALPITATPLELTLTPGKTVVRTPPTPPPVPPPIFFRFGRGIGKRVEKPSLKLKKVKFGKPKKTLVKTVFAGFWKVQESEIKFGKVTHPRPTKKIWKIGKITGWRIPTVELMKEKKEKEKIKYGNIIKRKKHYKKKRKKKKRRKR